jgi:hypothetical protein
MPGATRPVKSPDTHGVFSLGAQRFSVSGWPVLRDFLEEVSNLVFGGAAAPWLRAVARSRFSAPLSSCLLGRPPA